MGRFYFLIIPLLHLQCLLTFSANEALRVWASAICTLLVSGAGNMFDYLNSPFHLS